MLVAATNSQALWYLTRGFGLVTLVLLTASVVLGMTQIARFGSSGLQRFVVAGVHRNVSLLSIVFLAVHVVTAIADPYVTIRIVDAFIPFVGKYRPLWLGFGAIGLDLMLALSVSSLVRQHVGYRTWRTIHWAAYACWPLAVVHGLGTGSDTKIGWVQAIYVLCTIAVLAAFGWRLGTKWSKASYQARVVAGLAALVATAVVAVWTMHGPLKPGWAKKASGPPAVTGTADPATAAYPS